MRRRIINLRSLLPDRLTGRLRRTTRILLRDLAVRSIGKITLRGTRAAAWFIATVIRPRPYDNSVLHISYMVHIPAYTVDLLRRHGMRADYMAIGTSRYWSRCDYNFIAEANPRRRAVQELLWFWRVLCRYQVLHHHFMFMMSDDGWELPLLKKMGRKIVVHYRGCEARERTRNMELHPKVNICQDCDYEPRICTQPIIVRRRQLAKLHGDLVLVTTPDMKDFIPGAIHFPFFAPFDDTLPDRVDRPAGDRAPFKIVHVTNHPGIEGTKEISQVIENLRRKGYSLEFIFRHDISHEDVLKGYADADLAIGKMKMGYYANAQIESMAMGVPTITYVRDEFVTDDLRESGLILTRLDALERTIEDYLDHPEKLAEKRAKARSSILRLHDNDALAQRLIGLYGSLFRDGERGAPSTGDVPVHR